MAPPLQLRFVMSAPDVGSLPETASEVAFVGRSNVGKSSLINALANQTRLAQTSKTPGRTRLLNLFELADGSGAVVDLPGYGYAAAPGNLRKQWPKMIEGYLLEREQLVNTLVLVDGEVGPTKLDVTMLEWARGHELPFTVVATKHDKVKSSKREKRKTDLAEGCGLPKSEIVWVSAAKGTGIEKLQGLVRAWLAER
jgi:GTP-binding protein